MQFATASCQTLQILYVKTVGTKTRSTRSHNFRRDRHDRQVEKAGFGGRLREWGIEAGTDGKLGAKIGGTLYLLCLQHCSDIDRGLWQSPDQGRKSVPGGVGPKRNL